MKFQKSQHGAIPEIDLIPMLNVMMGILAFFVMITMSLANQVMVDVQVPGGGQGKEDNIPELELPKDGKELFTIKLDAQGQAVLNNQEQQLDVAQIKAQVQAYLEGNAGETVYLQPNPKTSNDQVLRMLTQMRSVGGSRVVLVLPPDQ